MISQTLLLLFFGLIHALISIVPSFSIPSGMVSAISDVFSLIATAGYFLPLGTFISVMSIMLAVYNIQIIWGLIHWVLRKIPGIS